MGKNNEELIRFGNEELFGKGNLAVVAGIFATDYVLHTGGKDYTGHEFIQRITRQLRSAIPDIQVVKVEILIQAGKTIAWQRTLSGTHKADMWAIPLTGEKVQWRDMVVSRFDGEKIAEEWAVSELVGELLSKSPCA